MRTTKWLLVALLMGMSLSTAFAQEEGEGKGRRRPPRNPPPAADNNAALQNQQQAGVNVAGAAGNANHGPAFDAAAWSTAMMQQFDADGDAKLDQAELAQCLAALAQMVQAQNQAQQRIGNGGPMGGGGGMGRGGGFFGPPGAPPDEAAAADDPAALRGRGGGGGRSGGGGGAQSRGNSRRGGG